MCAAGGGGWSGGGGARSPPRRPVLRPLQRPRPRLEQADGGQLREQEGAPQPGGRGQDVQRRLGLRGGR